MNLSQKLAFLLLGTIFLAACTPGAATPTVLPSAPTPTSLPVITTVPRLTEQALKNGAYALPVYAKTVSLTDGKYEGGSAADYLAAVLQPQIAFGDLNGDGTPDAAILIGENGGGSGVFVSLFAILNQNGQPVQAAAILIDDRPIINAMTIQDGKIILDAVIHQADDSMVAPSFAAVETYQLNQNSLTLTRLTSKTDTGSERSIMIASPVSGSEAGASVQVSGSMPIGPFENNLRLRLYDPAGNVLFEGPFAVQAVDMGAPATFDDTVDLSMIPAGTSVRLELAEISMRDGSLLSMDSVNIIRK
jgi:hypothetical protein